MCTCFSFFFLRSNFDKLLAEKWLTSFSRDAFSPCHSGFPQMLLKDLRILKTFLFGIQIKHSMLERIQLTSSVCGIETRLSLRASVVFQKCAPFLQGLVTSFSDPPEEQGKIIMVTTGCPSISPHAIHCETPKIQNGL